MSTFYFVYRRVMTELVFKKLTNKKNKRVQWMKKLDLLKRTTHGS
jgi:hypothetical protein